MVSAGHRVCRSRSSSSASRASIERSVRTRYSNFRVFEYRRFPRSTAFDVALRSFCSRNSNAFSRPGKYNFFSTSRSQTTRRNRARRRVRLAEAVAMRHRRSNRR
jgi:hypothetical protein